MLDVNEAAIQNAEAPAKSCAGEGTCACGPDCRCGDDCRCATAGDCTSR
ncbi:MAG TPA: hypothetical protein VD929_11125 [Caulobacteraceae bacterium]|nr:hypothetical protein [Caulobacteraceae bacterium]